MSENIDPVEFGALRQSVKTLTDEVHALRGDVAEMKATMAAAKGGWRMLMLIGGACATAGSAITWAISHLAIR